MPLTVKSAAVEHTMASGSATVLVAAVGARGGEQLYTVHFRKGDVSCAIRTSPSYELYNNQNPVPEQVAKAAAGALARDLA